MAVVGDGTVIAPFANEAMRLLREDWQGKYGAKMLSEELMPILQTGIPQPAPNFTNNVTINAGDDGAFMQFIDKYGNVLYNIDSSGGGIQPVEQPGYPPPKLKPTIRWGPKKFLVGSSLSSAELDAQAVDPETLANVDGTYVYTPASGTEMDTPGTTTLYVNFTPTDGVKYRTSMGSTVLTVVVLLSTHIEQRTGPTEFDNDSSMAAQGLSSGSFVGLDPLDHELPGVITFGTSLTTVPTRPSIALMVTFTPTSGFYAPSTLEFDYAVTGIVTPVITWADPDDITVGTALDGTQLNATATDPDTSDPVSGTFTYDPEAGTVLEEGDGQDLHVDFAPDDTASYNPASADVSINVTGGDHPDVPALQVQLVGTGTIGPGSVDVLSIPGPPNNSDDDLAAASALVGLPTTVFLNSSIPGYDGSYVGAGWNWDTMQWEL